MALRVIMKGKANSVEEAKRFISNNHGPEPRYIREDKEQNGKIWLSNQLGDPIGFYEPATKTVKMVDKKTTDADIKFVNKGQKFRNNYNTEIIITEVKPDKVQFNIKNAKSNYVDARLTKDPETMIKILNQNGYVPVKDSKTIDAGSGYGNIYTIVYESEGKQKTTKWGGHTEKQAADMFKYFHPGVKVIKVGNKEMKDAKMPVPGNYFVKGDKVQYGNRKGVVKNAYGDVVVVQLEGDPKGEYSHLSYYTVKYAKDSEIRFSDPMYKDTRRAVVREAEKYISSKGLNNSTGKYDKAIFGVRNLLEKTLLQPGTDKFNDAVHREVDRLLKKYNLTSDREPLTVIAEKNGYGLAVNEYNKLVLKFPGESYSNPHMYLGEYKGPYDKNYKKALEMFEKFAIKKNVNDDSLVVKSSGALKKMLKEAKEKGDKEAEKKIGAELSSRGIYPRGKGPSSVKDEEMEKIYSYSIKIGGDLKRVRVKADNSTEALEKVKKEAIKFKGERVKSKWDNNKLSTRDQD